MIDSFVSLRRVWRQYDKGQLVALRDVSLDIAVGEWLTVLGPSGCGKSTLLNLISGLDQPSQGEVWFEGRQPDGPAAWSQLRARRMGFIFQSFNLIPTLSALENVQVPMLGVLAGLRARRQRAEELLARVGLTERLHHLPGRMSGGERQRVAIARSLANAPALILADEPTGNLDSQGSDKIMALLREIHQNQGLTVVLVTHNPAFASLGQRWLHMRDGAIAQWGTPEDEPPCAL